MSKAYTGLPGMDREDAKEYITLFTEEFGDLHLYFAQHAAFPLALTPDLLYRLWVNFQRDNRNGKHPIPWIAVADLLLSSLCKEVRDELYEMDVNIRSLLLSMLKEDETLGMKRIQELSDFLLDYVHIQFNGNSNLRTSKLAIAQRWTALAYTKPGTVFQELSETLYALNQDKSEQIRVASFIEMLNVLGTPKEFEPIIILAQNIAKTEPNTEIQRDIPIEEDNKNIKNANFSIPVVNQSNTNQSKRQPNDKLRYAREERSWTQNHVAELIGAPAPQMVGRWERGEVFPNPHYRAQLCKVFGMTFAELGLDKSSKANPEPPISIFISYAQEDEGYCTDIEKHFSIMKRQNQIIIQHMKSTLGGEVGEEKILKYLNAADIVLLLISPDFIASDTLYENELKPAMYRRKQGLAWVIPIIVSETSDWKRDDLLGSLQVLPRNGNPISNWRHPDEAMASIVEEIRKILISIR